MTVSEIVYKFDDETGEYLNPFRCQPNPARPGEFLQPPANTTPEKPPKTGKHEWPVRRNGAWIVVPDFREFEYWLADGSHHKIEKLDIVPPADALDKEPPPQLPTPEELATIERQWRNSEIGVTDRCFAPDWGPDKWTDADRTVALQKVMTYRSELKTRPNEHPAFPDQSWRPIWPDGVPRPVQ